MGPSTMRKINTHWTTADEGTKGKHLVAALRTQKTPTMNATLSLGTGQKYHERQQQGMKHFLLAADRSQKAPAMTVTNSLGNGQVTKGTGNKINVSSVSIQTPTDLFLRYLSAHYKRIYL